MNAKPVFRAPQVALNAFLGDPSQNTQTTTSAPHMKRMSLVEDAAAIAKRAHIEHGTIARSRAHGDIGAPDLHLNVIARTVGPNCRTAAQVRIATGFVEVDVCMVLLRLLKAGRLQRSQRREYRYFQMDEVVE